MSPSATPTEAVGAPRPTAAPRVHAREKAGPPDATPTRVVNVPRAGQTPPRPTIPGFEILGELGRGGMGVVYKARQTALNRVVAVKMILAGGHVHESDRLRFLGEAEAVAAVRHPNVVGVYEFGHHQGLPYFAMEYLGGGSLAGLISDRGPLPPDAAARVVADIARGVQAAHDAGVVHRDLKPGNILLAVGSGQPAVDSETRSPQGSLPAAHCLLPTLAPKVSDFGLAKRGAGHDLTLTGAVMGTPAYMAPEQASGNARRVGPAADVYALGAILFATLTGRPPFAAADSAALLARVVRDDPPPVRRFAPHVPADLELICLKCLAKEPAGRYHSAAALAADLDRFRAGEPVSVRPPGRLEKAAKWVRRHPARAGIYALAAVAAGLAGLTAGVFDLWRTAASARDQAEVARDQAATARDAAVTAAAREREAKLVEAATRAELSAVSSARAVELANREFEANNVPRVREALDACRPDLRFWEWRYLDRATRRAVRVIPTGGEVNAVAAAPDGRVYTAGRVGVTRWNPDTWQPEAVRPDLIAARVTVSPDGRRVALHGHANRVAVLDAATGKTVWAANPDYPSLAFSPDGTTVAVADQTPEATVLDAATGRVIRTLPLPAGVVRCVAFDVQGRRIGVGGTEQVGGRQVGVVRTFDAATGKELAAMSGHGQEVVKIEFATGGHRMATIADDRSLQIWDSERGFREFNAPAAAATSVAFGRRNGLLVTGGHDRVVRVWEPNLGVELFALRGHTLPVRAVAFAPDDETVVSAGDDGDVRTWDVSGQPDAVGLLGAKAPPSSLAASPDGRWVVAAGERGPPLVYGLRHGQSPWDTVPGDPVESVRFTPAGFRLTGLTPGGDLLEWGNARPDPELTRRPTAARGVFAATPDFTRGLARSPDRFGGVIDIRTGAVVARLAGPNVQKVYWAALSGDGRRVLTGGSDALARVWDADTGTELSALKGHAGPVRGVAFSPCGTRLATGSDDGTVKLWDAATGRDVLTLRGRGQPVTAVAFSPDGGRLLACDRGNLLSVYDAGPGR